MWTRRMFLFIFDETMHIIVPAMDIRHGVKCELWASHTAAVHNHIL